MKTQSPTRPAAHGTLQNLVRQVMQKISAMLEERRVQSRKKAAADMLEQMDPRLLDDIGIAPPKTPHAMQSLAQQAPAVLAASVFSVPRKVRR